MKIRMEIDETENLQGKSMKEKQKAPLTRLTRRGQFSWTNYDTEASRFTNVRSEQESTVTDHVDVQRIRRDTTGNCVLTNQMA